MTDIRAAVTGDLGSKSLRVEPDRPIEAAVRGASLSSVGGLLLFRELDDELHLCQMVAWELRDNRISKNARHNFLAMFCQSLLGVVAS
ncbi:MAG: transposase [Paracoccaceae bacterium]|uniref:transposase n=1 Tax=Parasphingorhabdus sp. TaxID=2709688 RepID=UPI00326B4F10